MEVQERVLQDLLILILLLLLLWARLLHGDLMIEQWMELLLLLLD